MTDRHQVPPLTRRDLLAQTALGLGAAAVAAPSLAAPTAPAAPAEPFGHCLNTSTIRSKDLTLVDKIRIAAKAGYQAIEPWTNELKAHTDKGGSLADLRKQIADVGLCVPSAVTFGAWMVDDDARRTAAMEQFQRDMDVLAQIGGLRIAAPPSGGRDAPVELSRVAERYRALLELGRKTGVVPQLEIWGSVKTLSRLSEAAYVLVEAGHMDACVLLDAYQLYKANSPIAGLRVLNGAAMHVFHINDYPADPPREAITDAHRVYPGDGVAPLGELLRTLVAIGFRGMLSLELFNRDYWTQEPLVAARTGLEKTLAVVRKALAGQ